MKTEWKDISATKKSLRVVVPAETVEGKVRQTLQKLGQAVSIPGFRPGKAPASMIRARFRKEIKDEVLGGLAPECIRQATEQAGIRPVDDPTVEEVVFREGEPLEFTATLEYVPVFDLPEYRGIEMRREKVTASAEEGEEILKKMQIEEAEWIPVEQGPAEKGNLLVLDLDIRFPGSERQPLHHHDLPYMLGDSNLPAPVAQALEGMTRGARRETSPFRYPDDWYDKALAGQEAEASVELKEIKARRLPALDDDFARRVGGRFGRAEVQDLEGLRRVVAADLLKAKEASAERQQRDLAMTRVAEGVKVEIPASLVEREISHRLMEIAAGLEAEGIDLQHSGIRWEKIREDQAAPAAEAVRQRVVAERIAEREGIALADPVVDGRLREIAARTGESFEDLRGRLAEDGRLARLRAQMLRDLVVDFILTNARMAEFPAED